MGPSSFHVESKKSLGRCGMPHVHAMSALVPWLSQHIRIASFTRCPIINHTRCGLDRLQCKNLSYRRPPQAG